MNFVVVRRYLALCIAIVALVYSLPSCTVITTGSQTDAITRSGGWKFDSFPTGTPPASVRTTYTGSTIKFTSSGSSTLTTAAGQTVNGTWSWNSLTVLSLTQSGVNDTWEVVELNASTMRWSAQLNGATLEMKWTAN